MVIETEDFNVALPDVPGLRFRHYNGPADLPGMTAANMAVRRAVGAQDIVTVEMMTNQYANLTNCDTSRDLVIVEMGGEIVGYLRVEWGDQNDGSRSYDTTCLLHPEMLGRGIGSAMLAWGESRIREIAAGHETNQTRWFGQQTWDAEASGGRLLTRSGYRPVRTFYHMVRRTLDAIPEAEVPSGFDLRPVGSGDMRGVWDAEVKAFRDHWGGIDEGEEAVARFLGDPRLDPSLCVVAFAGDEVAGAVRNVIDDDENELFGRSRGVLDAVFVRRPYRRRGLARALIQLSLRLLRERGMTSAALGVDAENAHAALDLYRSCGFEIHSSNTEWRKPVDTTTETQE
jgi:mycothiol synthase